LKVIQIVNSLNLPDIIRYCIDQVKVFYPDHYLILDETIKEKIQVEPIRLKILELYPDALLLDWHIIPLKTIDFHFEPGKVYVHNGGDKYKNSCEGCVLFGNNAIDTIQKMKNNYIPGQCVHRFIRKNKSLFNYFPEGYFYHYMEK